MSTTTPRPAHVAEDSGTPVVTAAEIKRIQRTVAASELRLLSVPEACRLLGVGRTFLYDLMRTGQLEYVKAGRLRRVPADALAAYVAGLRANTQ